MAGQEPALAEVLLRACLIRPRAPDGRGDRPQDRGLSELAGRATVARLRGPQPHPARLDGLEEDGAAEAVLLENYLGFPEGIPGAELADRALIQAR